MWRLELCIALFFLVFPFSGEGAETYAGKWEMTSMTFGVNVESWGEFCGPRPVPYASRKTRPVEISVRGNHLIFTLGGLRTDRCGSPNPRLRKISAKVSAGSWKMVCETDPSDPKYERGVYTLEAKGGNSLEFKAVSRFDWTLKGDHCVAVSTERRIFVRVEQTPQNEPEQRRETQPAPAPEPESLVEEVPEEDPSGKVRRKLDVSEPWCDTPGPAQKIIVHPGQHRLGPGESVCFRALAIDERGCRTPVKATWTAAQNDQPVLGPLKQNGCFSAGDTAADAEGSYIITARVGPKSNTAEVSVVFPDLGELFAARLKPLQDLEDAQVVKSPVAAEPVRESLETVKVPVFSDSTGSKEDTSGLFWVIVGLLGAAFVGFMAVILLGMKRRHSKSDKRGDFETDFGEDSDRGGRAAPSARESGNGSQPGDKTLLCPKCGSELPLNARFCPHDGTVLQSAPEKEKNGLIITGSGTRAGMVCPNCHRGYDDSARFCPHDSVQLVPYPEWRKTNRTGRHEKS